MQEQIGISWLQDRLGHFGEEGKFSQNCMDKALSFSPAEIIKIIQSFSLTSQESDRQVMIKNTVGLKTVITANSFTKNEQEGQGILQLSPTCYCY